MTSDPQQAYVWIWLPGRIEPVVAGQLVRQGRRFVFTYGRSYRERPDAIALSPIELPLQSGTFEPQGMMSTHSCIRDAAPDAWGRRAIQHRQRRPIDNELEFMLLSGSDRIGALDFQTSPTEYRPRLPATADLALLTDAARRVEQGKPLPPDLDAALLHGTSVGGARPKAIIIDKGRRYIAKFSASTDTFPVVKAEYIAMRLAKIVGLDVPESSLREVMGRDVLLVERFDRQASAAGGTRKLMLSGLSLLQLDEMEAAYARYPDLADLIRQRFEHPRKTLRELFARLVFNILIGNTDDHARNHAAFWDGHTLRLTPAYDLCPQVRSGQEATQAMDIGGSQGRLSTLRNALSVHNTFLLSEGDARDLIDEMVQQIRSHWEDLADQASLAPVHREQLLGRAILNPFCFINWAAREA
jgi:serine/threonine-protein kinase HipA